MNPSPASPRIRVLHLEDSARDADIIGHKLEVGGLPCEIVRTTSREGFEAALQMASFDLILCDYNLPGYDGLSALKRAKAVRPDAPVIIISGSVGEDEAVTCLKTGATDYLIKDRLERLVSAVHRAIREAEERRSRLLAEEALQERERRLSSIYDSVADGLFYVEVSLDGLHCIVSVNPAFLTTTGLTPDEVLGKQVDQVISASLREHCERAIREKRIVRWEETYEFRAGCVTAEMSIAPVVDAARHCTHLVGTIHDVTERRDLETQLRQAQKMESVGQLAGGIAHDFNNLLTVINGTAEILIQQCEERGEPEMEADLHEIRRAGESAAGLTRQLLAFSRKQIVQPQILDLNAIVAEMGTMLRRLLGEDVNLVIHPGADATVKADRGQIEQVLANLAVNARDAMSDGGILTIETGAVAGDDPVVRELAVAPVAESYVSLAVRDTGSGMDLVTRRRIFEPFFTTKGPAKGTGLGLSTVYGIVKQSGGFINVDSEPGHGSCFTIYLPAIAGSLVSEAIETGPKKTGGHETVLVVEDVAGLRRLMTRTLEAAGYVVLVAPSGDDALRIIEQHQEPLHLVITDVVMPGMSGPTLAERLEQTMPGVKVLYMSGYTDDVVLRHGILEKRVPFINKPFGTADLTRKVREVLDS